MLKLVWFICGVKANWPESRDPPFQVVSVQLFSAFHLGLCESCQLDPDVHQGLFQLKLMPSECKWIASPVLSIGYRQNECMDGRNAVGNRRPFRPYRNVPDFGGDQNPWKEKKIPMSSPGPAVRLNKSRITYSVQYRLLNGFSTIITGNNAYFVDFFCKKESKH